MFSRGERVIGLRACAWLAVALAVWLPVQTVAAAPAPTPSEFAALVERLSEPGGDFGGDNLISNEQSYLHVLPALSRAKVTGGAYVGVGPDQNFSYIAHVKPEIAYLVDLRRDNLLLLLLFRALFAESPTRVNYLCLLTGREPPPHSAAWAGARIERLLAHVEAAAILPPADQQRIRERVEERIRQFGVPVDASDFAKLRRFWDEFIAAGLGLRFQVRGQPPREYYPTLRTLLTETDEAGQARSFLAEEARYQFVRALQAEGRIVPVVGDVSGEKAMRAIAEEITTQGRRVSAIYISNVEYYLFRSRRFEAYVENLKRFPHDDRTMLIRSVFPSGGSRGLPQAKSGYYSVSLTQPFATFLAEHGAGKYRSYRDLVRATAYGKAD